MAFPTFVISRSWVRVPQMAPDRKPLKTLRFKGFSFARKMPETARKHENGNYLVTILVNVWLTRTKKRPLTLC